MKQWYMSLDEAIGPFYIKVWKNENSIVKRNK